MDFKIMLPNKSSIIIEADGYEIDRLLRKYH